MNRGFLIFLLLIFTFQPNKINAQWITQHSTEMDLRSIQMFENGIGFIAGENGVVYRLNDFGLSTWDDVTPSTIPSPPFNFYDIKFLTENQGWVVGSKSVILITSDGGDNWNSPQNNFPSVIPVALYACERIANNLLDQIWVGGEDNFMNYTELYRTDDNGFIWHPTYSGISGIVRDLRFINNNIGYAVSTSGIYKTTSAGSLWISQVTDQGEFNKISFSSDGSGWAIGSLGNIFYSHQLGDIWNDVSPNNYSGIIFFSIAAITDTEVYVVGENGLVIKSIDFGVTWNNVVINESGENRNLYDISVIDSDNIWIIGKDGANYYSEGTTDIKPSTFSTDGDFEVGEVIDILFETTFNSFVDIEYSVDNKSNWVLIPGAYRFPSESGHFFWTIPSDTSSNCFIRITSSDKPQVQNISDGFRIFSKHLDLTSPEQAITLIGGEEDTIKWDPTNIDKVNLYFRKAPNDLDSLIADSVMASDLQYLWQIPKVNYNLCQVFIEETDGSPVDSSGYFKIVYEQFINISAPAQDDTLYGGESYTIRWDYENVDSVNVQFREKPGTSAIMIADSVPASHEQVTWIIPEISTDQGRIIINELGGNVIDSTEFFFIEYEKSLEITEPSPGQILIGGTQFTVRWNAVYIDSLNLLFRERPGEPTTEIVSNFPADNELVSWSVPKVKSEQCRLIIYEIGGDESDSTVFFTIKYDNTPPVIEIDDQNILPKKGEDLIVEVIITDENTTSNTLFFNQGGELTFFESTFLYPIGNNLYQATVPRSIINEQGINLMVKSVDSSPDLNTSLSETIFRPVFVDSLSFSILSSTPGTNETYQMISIHYDLEEEAISNVIKDEIEIKDLTKWGIWKWNPATKKYDRYPTGDIGSFSRGNSFWIASVNNRFVCRAGYSYPAKPYSFNLSPGWNQIGHPFAFPVRYSEILSANSNVSGLSQFYDYTNYNWTIINNQLEPRKGYFIKNQNPDNVFLIIPAIAANQSLSSASIKNANPDGWKIQLLVRNNQVSDAHNYLGVKESARTKWDPSDQPEPPPAIGKYISLYFPHDEWQQYPGCYTSDFRPEIEDRYEWNIEIETNLTAPFSEINFIGIESVPSQFEVYLLDEALKIFHNLRKNPDARITTNSYPAKTKLKLIVGKEESINQFHLTKVSSEQYELYQNYPNPFKFSTSIPYSMSKEGEVTLKIYNIKGETVAIILDRIHKEAGFHFQIWNVQNEFKQNVPGGLYFYQIIIGDFSETKKMFFKK